MSNIEKQVKIAEITRNGEKFSLNQEKEHKNDA